MTKLCIQFHDQGTCQYGDRCQYLHSVYDLNNLKEELSYTQALYEGARLTHRRNQQIGGDSLSADCLWANLKTSDGCGAPKKPRLQVFENIYNKENYNPELHEENYMKNMNMKRSNSVSSFNSNMSYGQ